jgi:hypothetical protein
VTDAQMRDPVLRLEQDLYGVMARDALGGIKMKVDDLAAFVAGLVAGLDQMMNVQGETDWERHVRLLNRFSPGRIDDPEKSTIACSCGQRFTWSGASDALRSWVAVHGPHLPPLPSEVDRVRGDNVRKFARSAIDPKNEFEHALRAFTLACMQSVRVSEGFEANEADLQAGLESILQSK